MKIKPCPFCGESLEEDKDDIGVFMHPSNNCILRDECIHPNDHDLWNTRKEKAVG